LLGFVALFLASGAIGFRFVVLDRGLTRLAGEEGRFVTGAARRAAGLGLLGAVVRVVLFATGLPENAARRHVTVAALLTGNAQVALQLVLLLLALAGFALAARDRRAGWSLAATGVIVGAIRAALFGQWDRLVNPLHSLAGGLWIGTLFMLVAAGLSILFRSGIPAERRGEMVAGMVRAFSPFALTSAGVLAVFGAITAWRHLKSLGALWTTPYGYALIAKLVVVMGVVGLGAWNWRRQKPRLGPESAARALHRSATAELAVAGLVLVITAILVSLPTPGRS
jgi:copper transport protein